MPAMDQDALAEIEKREAAKRFDDPRYEELLYGSCRFESALPTTSESTTDCGSEGRGAFLQNQL